MYGNVNNLDLFVGGLAENSDAGDTGSMLGPTSPRSFPSNSRTCAPATVCIFENQDFSPALMQQIQDTTLSDLILRDTDTTAIQADAFVATERHASNVASPDPTEPRLVIGSTTTAR